MELHLIMPRVNLTFKLMVGKLCLLSSDVAENGRCFKKWMPMWGKSMWRRIFSLNSHWRVGRCSLVLSPSLLFWVYSLLPFLASLGKPYSPHWLVLEGHKTSKMGHPIALLLKPFLCWCDILSSWVQVPLLCSLSWHR